jgi:hypothetical protein
MKKMVVEITGFGADGQGPVVVALAPVAVHRRRRSNVLFKTFFSPECRS